MSEEPHIQIGEHVLTEGQSMAVRVAITHFHSQVSDPAFAAELGPISEGYKQRLGEVLLLMLEQERAEREAALAKLPKLRG